MTTDFVLVLTTLPASADAAGLAARLVEERLAACVNVLPPMESVYRWKARIERDTERQLVIKTAADRVDALSARIHALHPYDVPELLVLPILNGSASYLGWITDSTRLQSET